MNILFLLRSLDIGGLEVVTAVLANKFAKEGHKVFVYSFEKRSGDILKRFGKDVEVTIAGYYQKNLENVNLLRELIVNRNIEIVINQWGLPLVPIRTLYDAQKNLNVKVISIYHNDPLQNGRIQSVEVQIQDEEGSLKKIVLRLKKLLFRCITGFSMRYVYQHSDLYEVLSQSFVLHFQQFTWQKRVPKLVVQTNPITIDIDGYEFHTDNKKKEIIYVGRIDYTQKRVYRVIETWALIESFFPDWQLTIVGDGEERENIKDMSKRMELKRVYFEGFQNPRKYYERASILMLTSEFEGFPLVLAECMSFGVVPVVYGSYTAVYDIIEDGKDGIIIPNTSNGFSAEEMAYKLKCLMKNEKLLNMMALASIRKSKNYSIDKIYGQWMSVFSQLMK